MKKYLKPESEVIEMDLQGMIASSPELTEDSATNNDCLTNDRSEWGSLW